MRRLYAAVFAAFCILFFAACGSGQSDKEAFLEDFEYIFQAMEDTFPYFGVAQRRLGVDIRALADETRRIIENYPYSMQEQAVAAGLAIEDMPEMDVHVFWSILRHEFFAHFASLGNSQVLDFDDRERLLNFYTVPAIRVMSRYPVINALIFTNHDVVRFYNEQEQVFTALPQENPALFQFLFRQDLPLTAAAPLLPVYTVEILEEGRIAYMHVSTFLVDNFRQHSPMMDRFFRDVQYYEHLIFDIRDADMGRVDFWRMLMMHVLWPYEDDMPYVPFYTFYKGTERARNLAQDHLDTEIIASRFVPYTDHLISADSILAGGNFPLLNAEDMQDLVYGLRLCTGLSHLTSNQFHFAQEQMLIPRAHIPFRGQIWLLTSENNTQAAAMFARQAKDMNFATLVGEATGGGYTSTIMTHFRLPNSNIIVRWDIDYITDQYGRSLVEFPTVPHYFNRPGMDALQTVLAMIGEMD